MKCVCGGKLKVNNTVVQGETVVRYRFCSKCSKKIKTIEVNVVRQQNDRFVLKEIKRLIDTL
jgi:hypothetical protein